MASLPPGWDSGTNEEGRVYYVHHESRTTQWDPPAMPGPTAPPPHYQETSKDVAYVQATAVPAVQEAQVQRPPQAVIQQPSTGPTVVVMDNRGAGAPPPGAPPGGQWVQEKYCGVITWLVGIFLFWCVCCCPCDDRLVYIVNGVRYNSFGAVVQPSCC